MVRVELRREERVVFCWYIDAGEEQSELQQLQQSEKYKGMEVYMNGHYRGSI